MNNGRYIFRGKRLDDGELIYGSHVSGIFFNSASKETAHYIMTGDFIDYDSFEDFSEGYGYYEVDPETIGRCTELKDRNGELLFEGDIVELVLPDDGEVRYFEVAIKSVQREIVCHSGFEDSTAIVEITGVVFMWDGHPLFPCIDEHGISDVRNIKVVGNIWENPELLKDIRND